MSYDYASRVALLEDPPPGELSPHLYPLCGSCADRLMPPLGWSVDDRRAEPPLFLYGATQVAADRSPGRAADGVAHEVTRSVAVGEGA